MATIYRTDGTVEEVEPKNGTGFSLKELYDAINSDCVEFVRISDNRYMVVDENGLAKQLDWNLMACALYHGTIVGDVLVCDRSQIK